MVYLMRSEKIFEPGRCATALKTESVIDVIVLKNMILAILIKSFLIPARNKIIMWTFIRNNHKLTVILEGSSLSYRSMP